MTLNFRWSRYVCAHTHHETHHAAHTTQHTHTQTRNAHFLVLFLRARCIGAQTFLRARSAAKIQATLKLIIAGDLKIINAWVRTQADMSSTGENVVVGGKNSWSYESFVNYDFFPSESFPILV
jgi:hypothetical protein